MSTSANTHRCVRSAFADEAGPSTAEQIAAIRRAGLKHIDLRGIDGHNISQLPLADAERIRQALDDAGIAVNMLGSPIGKIDITEDFRIDVEKLNHLGRLAPILGCNQVRIFSYFNKQDLSEDRWQSESLRRLRELRQQAQALGLVLFHENERHIFGESIVNVAVIARELRDGAVFKTIFDFDNYNQMGGDVWAAWQSLRDGVDAFHLKESDVEKRHVPAGTGVTRTRDILTDARSRGFHGPLIVEPHLQHSAAVMATGPTGQANQAFTDMAPADVFHIAVTTAGKLLDEVGL